MNIRRNFRTGAGAACTRRRGRTALRERRGQVRALQNDITWAGARRSEGAFGYSDEMRSQLARRTAVVCSMVLHIACPAGSHRTRTATVVHVEGSADVNHGSRFEPLTVAARLEENDVVRTNEKSFVVLQLANGRVQKLDEHITLRVADCAGFSAEPTSESAADQMRTLLQANELERLPPELLASERVAGFQATQRAGDTAGVMSRETNATALKDEGAKSAEAAPAEAKPTETGAGIAKASAELDGGAKDGAEGQERRAAARQPSGLSRVGNVPEQGAAAPSAGGPRAPGTRVSVGQPTADGIEPAVVVRVVGQQLSGFRRCHEEARASNPSAQGGFLIRAQVSASGALKDVSVVEDGIQSPAFARCVIQAMTKVRFPATPTPATFTIPLTFSSEP